VEGAVAYFYNAGTTTPRTVYQDAAGIEHANPVEALGDGNFPAIYVQGTGAYKIRLEDADGVLLIEYDELQGEVESDGGGGGGGTTIPTGFEMVAYTSGAVSGWVRENGRTIGSGASAASERANDDTEDLFLHLWGADSNLAVSGGRGASAAADWAANKTIALPDARGRVLVGLEDMGNTDSNRLDGGLFAFGNGITLGAYGGAPGHVLLEAELAAHTHGGTTGAGGDHDHGGTTGSTDVPKYSSLPASVAGAGNTTWAGTANEAHTHTIAASGTHTHAIASAGSGSAHNNMPPFTLRTVYLKL
jgi:microcystin-dependent protein